MTTHKPTRLSSGRTDGRSQDVRTWRRSRLLEAGFPEGLADDVAAERQFDLHELLELVDRGCPPELAVQILAPLPNVEAP